MVNSFFASGDLGDVISALPVIRQLGGGHLLLGPYVDRVPYRMARIQMDRERFESLKSLLEGQPYLESVQWCEDKSVATHDFSTFRYLPWNRNETLGEWQGRHVGCTEVDMSPWLTVPLEWNGRIVISRSGRYQNPEFPWKRIVEAYGERILFIGLPVEHHNFKAMFDCNVELAETKTLMDVAKLIKGSEIQFANQSAPFWIGAGLGKWVVQETCMRVPNSIIKNEALLYWRTPEEKQAILDFIDESSTQYKEDVLSDSELPQCI